MTLEWPPWDRVRDPGSLARYVCAGAAPLMVSADLAVRLPGPGQGQPISRARACFDVLCAIGIAYVHEPVGYHSVQLIRPLDQVLARPRQGTCLDLCLAFASICLDADVRTIVVVLDSADGRTSHAVALVWLDGGVAGQDVAYPIEHAVHADPPMTIDDLPLPAVLARDPGGSGAFLPLDVTVATDPGASADPEEAWRRAVERGAEMLDETAHGGGSWRWSLGVDVVLARGADDFSPYRSSEWRFARDLLVRPYYESAFADSPAMIIGARHRGIDFAPRLEFERLLDWASEGASDPSARLAVIHGVGGSGKTRLAAEVAKRLAEQGWYTGFLTEHPAPKQQELEWLQGVVSPTFAVIDYAEQLPVENLSQIIVALWNRDAPSRVVLTARSLGQWWPELTRVLARQGLVGDRSGTLSMGLPRHHPDPEALFAAAVRSFGIEPSRAPVVDTTWTTLDLVMYAWLAATGEAPPEDDAGFDVGGLRDAVIERELAYWRKVCRERGLPAYPDSLLARIGACVTLRAPRDEQRCEVALSVLPEFETASTERSILAHVITALLTSDRPADGLALRPDPVGERLVIRELSGDPALFDRALPSLLQPRSADAEPSDEQVEGLNALRVVTAAEGSSSASLELAGRVLERRPDAAAAAASVAYRFGGSLVPALLNFVQTGRCPRELLEVLARVPIHSAVFRPIAWEATLRVQPEGAELHETTEQEERLLARNDAEALASEAEWLDGLAARALDMGYQRYAGRAHMASMARRARLIDLGVDAASNRVRLAASVHAAAGIEMNTGDAEAMRALAIDAFSEWWDGLADGAVVVDDAKAVRLLVDHGTVLLETDVERARAMVAGLLELSDDIMELGVEGMAAVADLQVTLAQCALSTASPYELEDRSADLGRAVDAAAEAVRLRTTLFELDPGSNITGLCRALTIQSLVAAIAGREAESTHAIREATQRYREIARWGGPGIEVGLSMVLRMAAHTRLLFGDSAGALTTARDGLRILERLRSEDHTGSFRMLYAESLAEYGYFHRSVGDATAAAEWDELALIEWDTLLTEDFRQAFPRYIEVLKSAWSIDPAAGRAVSLKRRIEQLIRLNATHVVDPVVFNRIARLQIHVDAIGSENRRMLDGDLAVS